MRLQKAVRCPFGPVAPVMGKPNATGTTAGCHDLQATRSLAEADEAISHSRRSSKTGFRALRTGSRVGFELTAVNICQALAHEHSSNIHLRADSGASLAGAP